MKRNQLWNAHTPECELWLKQCANHLVDGGLALLPTETGYMFAANGIDELSLETLYLAKGRPSGQATHLAVDSTEMGRHVVDLREETWKILDSFGAGPLTLIGRARECVPERIHGPNHSLGIRQPDHPGTAQILRYAGIPLTATSANRAGMPHEIRMESILAQFPESVVRDLWVLQDDSRSFDIPSTMVLETESGYRVLREGPVDWEQLCVSTLTD